MAWSSNSQPSACRGTRKLIAKILQHPENIYYVFAALTKIGIILILSHWMAIVVLAVVIFEI